MTTPGMGDNLLGLPLPEIADMAIEEYAARILGLLCETARPAISRQARHARQLPANPGSSLAGTCRGISGSICPAGAIEEMKEAGTFDAKNRSRRFEADSSRRQAEASEGIRRAAEQWVAPQYKKLEQMRGQGLA